MKTRAKPSRRTRTTQPDIPGVEGPGVSVPRIAELDDIGQEYKDARDERMELTKKEVDAKGRLKGAMLKHGLQVYKLDDNYNVVLEPGEVEVKIKKIKAESNGSGDDDQE